MGLPSRYIAGSLALLAAFLVGGYFGRHDLFPIPALRRVLVGLLPRQPNQTSQFAFDRFGRLTADRNKPEIACQQQTSRTAVLLLLGQSNTGNHGGQRYRSKYGDKVMNVFDGRCFVAASPLLGSDGVAGEYWTELGNLLIGRGQYDRVILAPAAITGSEISRWSPGGDLNGLIGQTVERLEKAHFRVTHVLWHQGEFNYVIGSSERYYVDQFASLVGFLRSQGVDAPIYVSVASKCLGETNGGTLSHSLDNPIARAQAALPNRLPGLRSGINTDSLLADTDRYDDCHFGGSGAQKAAEAWSDLLSTSP